MLVPQNRDEHSLCLLQVTDVDPLVRVPHHHEGLVPIIIEKLKTEMIRVLGAGIGVREVQQGADSTAP